MTNAARVRVRIAGTAVALAGAIGVVHGSHVPVTLEPGTDAVLRIAFGARPERIEVCRELTPAEREARPAHMRQSATCEGTTARYHLVVRRDGAVIAATELRGGGLRSDRQLYAFHEIRMPSGPSEIEVLLVRVDSSVTPDTSYSMDASRNRRHEGEVPARLELRQQVTLEPRRVLLVTYDAERRRLRTMTGSESP